MKICITTDSTSDIPVSLQKELGISVLPLLIETEKGEYLDGVTITTDTFYEELLQYSQLPSSASVTPLNYLAMYEEKMEQGYTDVIHVSLNGEGSSTYQNACLGRDFFYHDHPELEGDFHIHCLDSGTYSMGYGLGVVQAARMARDGKSPEEIIAFLQDWVEHNVVLFCPLELSFVRRSGRVSGAAAFIGDALGLKPVITFDHGAAKTLLKARGEKMAMREMLKLVVSQHKPGTPVAIAGAMDENVNEAWSAAVRNTVLDVSEFIDFKLGCVITINSGPKAFGVVFRKE